MTIRFRSLAVAVSLIVAGVSLFRCGPALAELAVGAQAPDFSLSDLDGKTRTLAELRGKVVVLEWINPNCPFSRRSAKEKTMVGIEHRHPGVVWLAINSTRASHSEFLQPAAHKKYNSEQGIDYAVLVDSAGTTGKAYGAKATPHMFVIDEQGKVLYNGAIDDDPSGRKKIADRVNYVDKALAAHAAGQAADPASTQPYGCSIKY